MTTNMEADTMLMTDDGLDVSVTTVKKQPSKRLNKCKPKLVKLGVGFLATAFIALLVAVAILKTTPQQEKSSKETSATKEFQVLALEGIFSTNYIAANQSQSVNIKNIDNITDQLNTKLTNTSVQVIGAFFRNSILSDEYDRDVCEKSLSGMTLQLNVIVFYSRHCKTQSKTTCKTQFYRQSKEAFDQLMTIPLTIQFDDGSSTTINIKLCNLLEMAEEENSNVVQKAGTIPVQGRKMKTVAPVLELADGKESSNIVLKKSSCPMNFGKITLVQMAGELGSRIQDDTRLNQLSKDDYYRQYRTVTVFENMIYQLQVQLSCNQQIGRSSAGNTCELSQDVQAWIDFNNDNYDIGEGRPMHRIKLKGKSATNMYDLEVVIPDVDEKKTLSGPHLMRLTVMPSYDYVKYCGESDYKETRDYTVIIFPKRTKPADVVQPTVPPPTPYTPRDPTCSMNVPRIVLVLMAGQKGTEIRDDRPTSTALSDYRNQHHLSVTLYENTVYLIRIQLDCNWQLDQELFEKGCNLAQDVNVWIDLNNDGRYDESEIGAPYRWPVTSYLPEGIYDLQIRVPLINDQHMRSGQHGLRLVVTPSETYRRICGATAYNETRDYTANIISKSAYLVPDDVNTYNPVLLNSVACSPQINKVLIVIMAGEQRTQIRDEPSMGLTFDDDNQNQPIVLYQDGIYILRIQLDCSRQWNDKSYEHNCQLIYDVNVWIDLNDDGEFDPSENAAPYRWPLNSYTPKGIYDLQIYTPIIDSKTTTNGPHKMQLVVTTSEPYRQKCGNNDYKEIRNYKVYIIPYRTLAVDVGVPYVPLSDGVCAQQNGKIVLVIMAGEQGTEIRDNIPTNIVLRENQNRHHLAVSLYENTAYRLRIQLACRQQSDGTWSSTNCNLAKDVNVFIDLNNDGTYDANESRTPRRWPLHSSIPLGIYDFEIDIPLIDRRVTLSGSHRMRIVVAPSSEYETKCGRNDYQETREYTVVIIPRVSYPGFIATYCSPGNFACTKGTSAFSLVELVGEKSTKIYDDTRQCNALNNYLNRNNENPTLFDNTAYTLHIQLYCIQGQDTFLGSSGCNYNPYFGVWIDFNDDGTFDPNTEQVLHDNDYPYEAHLTDFRLTIVIPELGGGYYRNKPHRMRVLLTTNERNMQPCYNKGPGDARDYTVQIVSRSGY